MGRRSTKPTGEVWRLLEAWAHEHPLKPNQTQMAGLFEVSDSLLGAWKYCESAMQTEDLVRISAKTNLSEDELSRAVRADMPAVVESNAARRNPKRPPRGTRAD